MTENSPFQAIAEALRRGDAASAETLAREALSRSPDNPDLLFPLALSLHMQRKPDAAIPAYRRLTQLQPDSAAHWSNYATALSEVGHDAEAEAAWRQTIVLDPHTAEAHLQLGLVLIARRQYTAARDALLDAFERDRASPRVRIHAANACMLCQDFHGTEDLLEGWRQWLPLHDDALQVELARMLALLADAPGSHLLLADLVARNPAAVDHIIQLARMEERLNLLDSAKTRLSALNGDVLTLSQRAELDRARAVLAERDGDFGAARALLEAAGPAHADDSTHFFLLAKCDDKLGERQACMAALERAHALQKSQHLAVVPDNYSANAAALPARSFHVTPEQYARWPQFRAPETADSPVFVVGFPRSGTTLLEQMLDAHPHLQSMDENPFFDRLANKLRAHDERILDDLSVLRQYDCDELRKRYRLMAGKKIAIRANAQLVDKNPLNLLWLPLIHRLFPKAKCILCLRHSCDVILSCYMQNFRSGLLAAACENLPRLAGAYVQAMQNWLHHAEVFRPDVLVSRYEDLVADFAPQTRRIADFLGLDDATPMLRFDARAREKGYIATPSYTQVIEPVNTKALGRWQRYREWFEPVLPTLQPMLEHWGYSTDPV
ncbi:MAG: sulfotransferase [Xanthomonadaceae bacterium]|nr:sulfotransferase [Xanthomonadaceae bacterium]